MKFRITVLCLLSSVFCLLTGCSSVPAKLAEFERLGITEAHVTGKFSNTDYKVTKADGIRRAEITHSNAWLPKVHLVRETPEFRGEPRENSGRSPGGEHAATVPPIEPKEPQP